MFHASYSFPSHWVMFLELGLSLAAAGWLLASAKARWPAAVWTGLRHRSARPGRVGALLALAVVAALAVHAAFAGFPVPSVNDEFGHLLIADTFAHGHVANPPPRLWRHFEAVHVILQPSYTAKYPPAPGLVLAAGQVLGGHPGVGLWLSCGLLCAAAMWGLAGGLPPPWPLLGAIVVALRLVLGSYWGHSYWGGTVPAAAAFVVFGAVLRLCREPRARDALLLGLGLTALANSRPYEGVALALPLAALLAGALVRAPRQRRHALATRLIAPLVAVLAVGAALTLYYHWRVTGDPWVVPYTHYRNAHGIATVFSFLGGLEAAAPWPARFARLFATSTYTLLGLPLMVAALAAARVRWNAALLAAGAALLGGVALMTLNVVWIPHYAAPLAPAALFLGLQGLRRVCSWRLRGRRLGPRAPLLVVAVYAGLVVLQLPGWRPDADDWSLRRQQVLASLESRGGRHLVFLDPAVRAGAEWLYNPADWERAPVLLTADLGANANAQLVAAYPGRTVWSLVPRPRSTWPSLRAGPPPAQK